MAIGASYAPRGSNTAILARYWRTSAAASYENLVRQPLIISEPELEVDGWDEAEAALAAAQQMPGGPERIAALKKAEQLRFRAEERQGAILKSSLY
jgi:hypothetical protein